MNITRIDNTNKKIIMLIRDTSGTAVIKMYHQYFIQRHKIKNFLIIYYMISSFCLN